jgi:hypothetical protein
MISNKLINEMPFIEKKTLILLTIVKIKIMELKIVYQK